jgi:hypothetical protein
MDGPAAIHSVLARCLTDVRFLAHLTRNPHAALATYGLDEDVRAEILLLDTERVRQFAGFVLKVQHNELWSILPRTREWLIRQRVENVLFSRYLETAQRLRRQGQLRGCSKVEAFVRFVETHLGRQPRFAPLIDLLRHEYVVWQMRRECFVKKPATSDAGEEVERLSVADFCRLVPSARGSLRIARFRFDPVRLASKTRERSGLVEPFAQPKMFAYHIDCGEQLTLLELNRASALLLQSVDGRRTVAQTIRHSRRRGLRGCGASAGRMFLLEARKQGLIRFTVSAH